MLPFQNLIILDKSNKAALYKQINNRLISLIQEGTLHPGMFLPGTRQMAETLGVNRKTIINAYEELHTHEWIVVVPRKGYCVTPELPVIKPRSFHPVDNFTDRKAKPIQSGPPSHTRQITSADIVINDGFPDTELAPFKDIGRIYRDQVVSHRLKQLMSVRDEGGLSLLREAASLFINETRGLHITQNNMVITRGAQMAIFVAVSILVKPGDTVVVSDPNYLYANEIFINSGANIVRIPVDQDGMDINQLEKVLEKQTIKLLYIVPHHHHPTTVTLTAERRVKLLQLIEKYDFYVIEDDYDYDFHYQNNPILPLASSHHNGKIIYIGSFTKILAPSIRIGYLIAAPEIITKAIYLRRLIDLRGDTFLEYSLSEMIINGQLSRHINKSLKLYSRRCDYFCRLLEQKMMHAVEFTKPAGGMAVWLRFKPAFPVDKVVKDAGKQGLVLAGMSYQQPGNINHNGIRLGFASLSEDSMERAVQILVNITT